MKKNINNILAVIGFVLLLGFAYYLYTQQSSGSLANTSSDASTMNSIRSNQIVDRLSSIKTISLDGAIFSDPDFRALLDFSIPISPVTVGKPNPFE